MKRLVVTTVLAALCVTMMTGCGAMIAMNGGGGVLYQDTKAPLAQVSYWGPGTNSVTKTGEASYMSILGIVTMGDASLKEAMAKGGITKVHHIDQQVTSILGIVSTYKIIVYGE